MLQKLHSSSSWWGCWATSLETCTHKKCTHTHTHTHTEQTLSQGWGKREATVLQRAETLQAETETDRDRCREKHEDWRREQGGTLHICHTVNILNSNSFLSHWTAASMLTLMYSTQNFLFIIHPASHAAMSQQTDSNVTVWFLLHFSALF